MTFAPATIQSVGPVLNQFSDFTREEAAAFANGDAATGLIKDALPVLRAARLLHKIAYEFACPDSTGLPGEKPWLQDNFKNSVNPFYNQTQRGMVFEVYYGQPGKIWTPFGEWNCWGSGAGRFPMEKFLARFQHELLGAEIQNHMGCYGPYYIVRQVGDVELPRYEAAKADNYLPYELARAMWVRANETLDKDAS